MSKNNLFLVVVLGLALVFVGTALALPKPAVQDPAAGAELRPNFIHPELMTRPSRDFPDDYWGLRYMFSQDGGRTWSGLTSAGDAGMWEVNVLGETVPVWAQPSYDYGAVVDPNNILHYMVILNSFSDVPELNPFSRVNGLYHVSVDVEGNAAYHLIAAEDAAHPMFYSDAGMKRNGQLYCIWASYNLDEEGAPASWSIHASKSTDAGVTWSEPFLVVDNIGYSGYNYCHMTSQVGHNFFVVYQHPGETGQAHSIAKVPESLSGEVSIYATGHESGHPYYAYKFGPCNPIQQDADTVYYVICNEDYSGVHVGTSLDAGVTWQAAPVAGVARYPSLGFHDNLPYFFSNFGVPAAGSYHENCYFYDEIGFGGGSWVGPIIGDNIAYDGTRTILYINQSVWTPSGTWMRGCSMWGAAPIEGALVSVWTGEGDVWSPAAPIWTIFDEEPLNASSIADPTYLAGTDDFVWAAFTGLYGVTDFEPPVVNLLSVSSYMLGEPRVVAVEMTDDSGIDYADVNTGLNYHDPAEGPGGGWVVAEQDSITVDLLGSGTYYFHLPDSVLRGGVNTALVAGDQVEFYFDTYDNNGNYGAEHNGEWMDLWIVNQGIQNVGETAPLPAKLELGSNYPNPFNSLTTIPFALDRTSEIKIAVYDLSGRLVDVVFEGYAPAGSHFVNWRADGVPAGIYFYTLETAGKRQVAKLSLLR